MLSIRRLSPQALTVSPGAAQLHLEYLRTKETARKAGLVPGQGAGTERAGKSKAASDDINSLLSTAEVLCRVGSMGSHQDWGVCEQGLETLVSPD